MTTRRVLPIAALAACGLAATATTINAMTPGLSAAVDYTLGYAPWWVGLAGAALGAATVTVGPRPSSGGLGERRSGPDNGAAARRHPLAVAAEPAGRDAATTTARPGGGGAVWFVLGWAAAIVLLWASAGVVLDGFRAFFAITGIPAGDFAVVDWFGFAARFLSLVACAAVLTAVIRHRSEAGDGCRDCGRIVGEALGRVRPGVLALVLVWPYPLLKAYWWLGGELARPGGFDEGLPAGELLAAVAGTVLFLAMTLAWWRRGVLRRLTLAAGWSAVAVLLSMGALSFFGTVSQVLGLTDGPVDFDSGTAMVMVGSVYGSWLALGIAVTVLTWRYQRSTRPVCSGCSG